MIPLSSCYFNVHFTIFSGHIFPVRALLFDGNLWLVTLYVVLVSVVMFMISIFVWTKGLRRYESAGVKIPFGVFSFLKRKNRFNDTSIGYKKS